MATLAVIGDVHARFARLEPVLERIAAVGVDGVLLVGDIGSHHVGLAQHRSLKGDAQYRASVDEVLSRVAALGVPIAWVPGNHDLPDAQGPGKIDGSSTIISGLRIAGIGGAGPHRYGFCYEWDEDHVRGLALPECDVLLCHAPPARTPLDHVPFRKEHVGSEAIRERAELHEGFLVCGHIHESPGAIQLGDCLCLNVGGLGDPFGKVQVGFIRRQDGVDTAWHEDIGGKTSRSWLRF